MSGGFRNGRPRYHDGYMCTCANCKSEGWCDYPENTTQVNIFGKKLKKTESCDCWEPREDA